MNYFQYKTKGNAEPWGKARVYFTCHPDDFAKYFDQLSEDLLDVQDCAIYYTADMSTLPPLDEMEVDLCRMNLFVIPVTYKFMTSNNRALQIDCQIAKKYNIPILPLVVEDDLDDYYYNTFGTKHYIKPFSHDQTEVPYKQKLKAFLESTIGLINEGTIQKVHEAFSARAFLSYRKKDRIFANTLINKIHSKHALQALSIWYDEFLRPGEDFNNNIHKVMDDSNLILLLITPNVVNEPNFVQREEYPLAKSLGKKIIPAIAMDTDPTNLTRQFPDMPSGVDINATNELLNNILNSIEESNLLSTWDDPNRCFLIGLAYLYGIDNEVNSDLAVSFFTTAANKGHEDSIAMLYSLYTEGIGVAIDYDEALDWAKMLVKVRQNLYGRNHKDTLKALSILSTAHINCGNYAESIQVLIELYEIQRDLLGEVHQDTLRTLHNLATAYDSDGNREYASDLFGKAYFLRQETLGDDHHETLTSLFGYASSLDDYPLALALLNKAYDSFCRLKGETSIEALSTLMNISGVYIKKGEYKKASDLLKATYFELRKSVGEKHPKTLDALDSFIVATLTLEKYEEALDYAYELFSARTEVLGEHHPLTIRSYVLLATIFSYSGNYKDAIAMGDLAYKEYSERFGENHPEAIKSLIVIINAYARSYADNNDYTKAIEYRQKKFVLESKLYGENDYRSLRTLADISMDYVALKDYEKAREFQEIVYNRRYDTLGPKDPATLDILLNYAISSAMLGYVSKALTIVQSVYDSECEIFGYNHPRPQKTFETLSHIKALARFYN